MVGGMKKVDAVLEARTRETKSYVTRHLLLIEQAAANLRAQVEQHDLKNFQADMDPIADALLDIETDVKNALHQVEHNLYLIDSMNIGLL